ncbi:hypothetical protein [Polyangium mundeleinium]|uniref:Uncharacterized protein n=1 Tax=Polyangium mundeleinium TaxID=2995306 RepID=A0ABT5F0S6_9BACT|nr:hypothetical protein [Polyangium mundeleinium]MDC0746680.1 hypothetical protein [Polyangium mundeleinium]
MVGATLAIAASAWLLGGGARLVQQARKAPTIPARPVAPAQKAQGAVLPKVGLLSPIATGHAGGYLMQGLRDDVYAAIRWLEVPVGDLVVTMAADAVQAFVPVASWRPLRLPVSYADTVEACRVVGDCVAPNQEIVDAAYALSSRNGRLVFNGLVHNEKDEANMTTLDFTVKFNTGIDRQLAKAPHPGMRCGAWKYWILHSRIREKGAVNYGGFAASGAPIQTVGGRHGPTHYDYSQLFQPVRRYARTKGGARLDLLERYAAQGVPAAYLEKYR